MPCRAVLELVVWARTPAEADALLAPALGAALADLVGLDVLELARETGFTLRLLKPQARLAALERGAQSGQPGRSLARLVVDGELELTLARGVPEPEGRIERIEISRRR